MRQSGLHYHAKARRRCCRKKGKHFFFEKKETKNFLMLSRAD
jgi:hypothetical protein